jgi:hypothetical protein
MPIPTTNLRVKYDISNPLSYSGTGNTVYDLTANNYDLTLSNVTYESSKTDNLIFTATSTSTATYSGSIGINTTTPLFTFFMWVNTTSFSSASYNIMFAYGRDGNPPIGGVPFISTKRAGSNDLSFEWGSGASVINSGTAVNFNEWVNYAVTCDGTTSKLYKNGSLIGSVALGGSQIWTPETLIFGDLGIGAGYVCNFKLNYFEGYNIALSAGDILTLYNDTKDRFVEPIISYDFSDPACYPGSGSTVFDLSGSGLDLPISGATYGGTGQSKYFEFSGGSSYIGKTGVSGLGTSFSISIWSQTSSSAIQISFYAGTDSPPSTAPAFYYNLPTSGEISGSFNWGTGLITEPYVLDTWENYVYTANGTTAKLYKNGVEVGSVSQGAGNWPNGKFYLGYTEAALIGKIATLDIYNSALNSGAVTDIYDNTENRFFPAPPPAPGGIVGGRQFAQGFNG